MEPLHLNPEGAIALVAARAKQVAAKAGRRVAIGLAGGPGVGKSTIAAEIVRILNLEQPDQAALVQMDGFHMRHKKLEELGLVARKGAPETFEGASFAAYLMRVRGARRAATGPAYSREIEDVLDNAVTIPAEARMLIVEGNYLLLPTPPWDLVRPLLDLAVFLHVPRDKVMRRLMKRHGENPAFSEKRNRIHVARVDLPNYDLVETARGRADLVIELETAS